MSLPRRIPLQRRTELQSSPLPAPRKPLEARGGLKSAPLVPTPRAAQKTPQKRATGPTRAVRGQVLVRDGHVCVACGRPGTDWNPLTLQHRKTVGMGGSTDPAVHATSNLITMHQRLNVALEADADEATRGLDAGWKLKDVRDALTTPVLWWDGSLWILDDEGGRRPA